MPDTPSITINKEMTYRGKPEVTSNTYHFSGTVPSSDTAGAALGLAIFNAEAPLHPTTVKYAGYLGYEAGNEHAVSIKDHTEDNSYPAVGTGTQPASSTAGDLACWVRWATPDRTSRGKRIYLRKYFHEPAISDDAPTSGYYDKLMAFGAKMKDGSLPGGMKICGPQGAVAGAHYASPFVTTRTLKRRGRRPSR